MRPALPPAARRLALAVGFIALVAVALQISVGGFRVDVFGLRLSSRSLARPLVVAIVAFLVLLRRADREAALHDARRLEALLERAAPWIAGFSACVALAVGLWWGTRAAGGSDSYCYIGQAEEFAAGRAILREPLAREVNLPHPDRLFAPVGFVPSPRGGAVPMCPPGLSLVMAAAWKAGGESALHAVVPLFGALCVWCAFVLGCRVHGAAAGASAAVLMCASPVFLYQVVQPMSDVPAASLWAAVLALLTPADRRREIAAGAAASLAILTRPNLVPVLIPICAYFIAAGRRKGFSRFVAGLAPGVMVLAALNQHRYGAPWRTGYGDTGLLFALANVVPNAHRYWTWLIDAQTPFILLAFAMPFVRIAANAARADRAFTWMSVAFVVAVVACYLPYTVFDAWWYTRFLLPALPVALALASATLVAIGRRIQLTALFIVPVVAGLAAAGIAHARSHDVFALRSFERRFIVAGKYVAQHAPAEAVVVTIQQSGAVRHYARRPAALWDSLAPDGLDEAVAEFERRGRIPLFLLEDWEEQGFRERFASERLGRLDWAPAVELPGWVRVRLYDPRDRPR